MATLRASGGGIPSRLLGHDCDRSRAGRELAERRKQVLYAEAVSALLVGKGAPQVLAGRRRFRANAVLG